MPVPIMGSTMQTDITNELMPTIGTTTSPCEYLSSIAVPILPAITGIGKIDIFKIAFLLFLKNISIMAIEVSLLPN